MIKLLTILLTTIFINANAQTNDCGCFDGIGSSESDKPSLTVEFSNGTKLSVCGYEQEKINENEIQISEFNIFNCQTGEQLLEYGAVQNCIVKKKKNRLEVIELKFLPAGENWKWKEVEIGLQKIFVKDKKLIVLEQKPTFKEAKIDETKADIFFEKLSKMRRTGRLENPEEILGRLEFLALNNSNEAGDILYDFENYFNYQTDGAIAEQWKNAVATVKSIKK